MSDRIMSTEPIDPDPMVLAGLVIAGVSATLQLVQTYQSLRQTPPTRAVAHADNQRASLLQLEGAVENIEASLKRISRSAERGSTNSDGQFYDAPLRVSETILMLDSASFDEYNQGISNLANQVGAISLWVGLVIKTQPDLAYRLGERMGVPLTDAAEALNTGIAKGGPVRNLLAEAKQILAALADAIEQELRQGN